MKENNAKVLTVVFIVIILFCFISIFFILNGNNDNSSITKTNYTKEQILDLIKAEDNKNNYEVEYSIDGVKYNKKYFNKKMVSRSTILEDDSITYIDFESDTCTNISENEKTAVVLKQNLYTENYIPNDILSIIENPDCIIIGEGRISNRDVIVLEYNGILDFGDGFYFDAEGYENVNNKVDKVKYNEKIWIDKETGLLLQIAIKGKNVEVESNITFNLKLNTVTEEDVTIPDLSGYKVIYTDL